MHEGIGEAQELYDLRKVCDIKTVVLIMAEFRNDALQLVLHELAKHCGVRTFKPGPEVDRNSFVKLVQCNIEQFRKQIFNNGSVMRPWAQRGSLCYESVPIAAL